MRASSFRSSSPWWNLAAGVGLFALAGLVACTGDDPDPQKLERVSPFDRGDSKRPPRDPNDPLRNPSREPPRGRDGEQLAEAEILKVLAEATKAGEAGNTAAQRNALRRCANKTPADARCDGEMGLAQIKSKNRRAAALYYLLEAAGNDDPKVDGDLYRRVGAALRTHGRYDQAAVALRLALVRAEGEPEIEFELGRTLSMKPESLPEAVELMASARTKTDRLEWLYEEAVLRGQMPVAEQAAEAARLLRIYLEQAKTATVDKLPGEIEAVTARATELEAFAKALPSQAEIDAQQSKLLEGKPASPPPASPPAPSPLQ